MTKEQFTKTYTAPKERVKYPELDKYFKTVNYHLLTIYFVSLLLKSETFMFGC